MLQEVAEMQSSAKSSCIWWRSWQAEEMPWVYLPSGNWHEVGLEAGAELEGDASPLVLTCGILHLLDIALEVRVDEARSSDFEEMDDRVLSDADYALFGTGVEAGEGDADGYG